MRTALITTINWHAGRLGRAPQGALTVRAHSVIPGLTRDAVSGPWNGAGIPAFAGMTWAAQPAWSATVTTVSVALGKVMR